MVCPDVSRRAHRGANGGYGAISVRRLRLPVPTPPDLNVDQLKFVLDLRRRGIIDAAVLRAMEEVPRDRFVMPAHVRSAYLDSPMPIPCRQTISPPFVVPSLTHPVWAAAAH